MLAGLGRLTIDTAPEQIGRLTSYDGLLLEASGLSAPVGTVCSIETAGDSAEAEVIGFRNGRCILMALGQRPELLPDARVRAVSNQSRVDVGPGLLGRGKIGRAHVCTHVTNAQLVCRLLLEKLNTT